MADDKNLNLNLNVEVKGGDKIKGVNKDIKEVAESGSKLPGVFGQGAEALGGMVSAIGKMTKAALTFIATPLGAVIAGIAVAISAVKAAFSSSEENQNKFAKLMGVIGAISEKVLDIFEDLGNFIISAFENPKKAITDFANLIKTNIVNRFEGLIELVPALGKAIELVFKGKFSEAGKVATDATAKVALGVDHVTDRINAAGQALDKFVKDTQEAANKAAKVADLRAKADKEEREFSTKKLELEAKIAQIREDIADADGKSAVEKKRLIGEAKKLNQELFDQEDKLAKQRLEAQKLEATYTDDTKENKQKLVDAENKVIESQLARAQAGRKLEKEEKRINNEAIAEAKRVADEKAKIFKDQQEANKKAADDAYKSQLESLKVAEEEELLNLDLTEQEKLDIKIKYNDQRKKLNEDDALYQKQIALQQVKDTQDFNAKKLKDEQDHKKLVQELDEKYRLDTGNALTNKLAEIQANNTAELTSLQTLLEQKKLTQDEYNKYVKEANDKSNQEVAEANKAAAEEDFNNKFNTAQALTGALTALNDLTGDLDEQRLKNASESEKKEAKKQFERKKALGIAAALISGIQGVINTITAASVIPEPFGTIAKIATAATIAASTAAQISKIKSQTLNIDGGGSGGGGGAGNISTGGGSSNPSNGFQPSYLNKIGGSGGTGFNNPNQPKPKDKEDDKDVKKIYVVSQDITSSQNKDAVLERRASFNK